MCRILPAVLLAIAAGLLAACAEQPQSGVDDAVDRDEPADDSADDSADVIDEVESFDDEGAADELAETLGGLPVDAWTLIEPSLEARTEVAAAAYLDRVWAVGGFGADSTARSEVLIYHPAFDEWESGPPLPQPLHHTAVVARGNELLVVGGYVEDGFDRPTDAVWRFDPTTGQWSEGPSLPEPRAAGAAAFDGQRVVYGGGVGPDGLTGDVWALEGEGWRQLGRLAQPREHLAAASDGDGRVWLLAGRTGGLDTNLATVDLVADGSITTIGELPSARGGLAGFYHPDVGACGVGGENPTTAHREVECIDADGSTSILPPLQEPRHGLGAAVIDDAAYAVMGGAEPGLVVSDTVEALSLER